MAVTPCRNTMTGKRYTIKAYIEPKRQKGIIILIITSNEFQAYIQKEEMGKMQAWFVFWRRKGQLVYTGFTAPVVNACLPEHGCAQEKEAAVFYTSDPNPEHETKFYSLIPTHF